MTTHYLKEIPLLLLVNSDSVQKMDFSKFLKNQQFNQFQS